VFLLDYHDTLFLSPEFQTALREIAFRDGGSLILHFIGGFCSFYAHFDGFCIKIDGNGRLGGAHFCAVVRRNIAAGRSEEAENPGKSRRYFNEQYFIN
jgi:hypothetical protein